VTAGGVTVEKIASVKSAGRGFQHLYGLNLEAKKREKSDEELVIRAKTEREDANRFLKQGTVL